MVRIEDLSVGQKVRYLDGNSYGLRHDWDATVIKINAKRVTITRDLFPMWKPLSVDPKNLKVRREVP
jgi:hypothetical protein